jgi:hypothetical protein
VSLCPQFFHQCGPAQTCPECGCHASEMLRQYHRKLWRDDLKIGVWVLLLGGLGYLGLLALAFMA